eukprot:TRINITY_DN3390_c0_g1_i1.p1 TRINITY_DN3390_c0_g1~~TRINITY_DN3390_c0_g1_i1.p1  ORF type:complete len:240 (-),score=29.26 TRINITY_DN3390_c0_g1_i1:58-732(-)
MYGFPPPPGLLGLQETIPTEETEPPRKKPRVAAAPKRSPYTRLACFNCRDKHQKCDGQTPVCFNCMSKGLDCQYREERNKRKDDFSSNAELQALRGQVDLWKQKYFDLKRFVDETLYHISLSQQLMPFMTQPNVMGGMENKLNNEGLGLSDSMLSPGLTGGLPGLTGGLPSFELLPQPLNLEGQAMFTTSPLLLSNPTLGQHNMMTTSETSQIYGTNYPLSSTQ